MSGFLSINMLYCIGSISSGQKQVSLFKVEPVHSQKVTVTHILVLRNRAKLLLQGATDCDVSYIS